jgi:hypothetical protein
MEWRETRRRFKVAGAQLFPVVEHNPMGLLQQGAQGRQRVSHKMVEKALPKSKAV